MNGSLAGKRILITRAPEQATEIAHRLKELNTIIVSSPIIKIEPTESYDQLDVALQNIEQYRWIIFTSANGVKACVERVQALDLDLDIFKVTQIAVVGEATARTLDHFGLHLAFVPSAYTAETLAHELQDVINQKILLLQGDRARKTLATILCERRAYVDAVTVYRTVPGANQEEIARRATEMKAGKLDAILFTSPSTLHYFMEGLATAGYTGSQRLQLFENVKLICIGPVTAQAVREAGLQVAAVAEQHTVSGIIQAAIRCFDTKEALQ